jgi:hypothetical protein
MRATFYSLAASVIIAAASCIPIAHHGILPRAQSLDAVEVPKVFAVASSVPLDTTGWTVEADSFQVGNEAAKVIDGDPSSFWHLEYTPNLVALPHKSLSAYKVLVGLMDLPIFLARVEI